MEAAWNSYQDDRSRGSADSLMQEISGNVQKISQNVVTIERMVNQLGTAQDNEQLRTKLHDMEHDTMKLSQKTHELLSQFNSLPHSDNAEEQRKFKILREKMTKDFATALNNFQALQRKTAQKEKAGIVRAKYDANEAEGGQGLQAGLSMQQQAQVQQVDIQTMRERQEAMTQLESDINDVNEIFKNLAVMVHDQGETLDNIEANVDNAQIHVQQGVSQVAKAAEYQRKYRRKRCMCIIISLAVAVVLGLIIYFSVKN